MLFRYTDLGQTGNDSKYYYFVALTLNDSTSKDIVDVIGTITLRKTSGGTDYAFDNGTIDFNVSLEVGYATVIRSEERRVGKEW